MAEMLPEPELGFVSLHSMKKKKKGGMESNIIAKVLQE